MKLILCEKPSSARTIAHVVGANEREFGENGTYCYKNDEYYLANARGHIYDLGKPQDYGYSKSYKPDELPMFPEFEIYPTENTADLRDLISQLMNRENITEIICATDAGREGELIFRQIYQANNCTKPVRRLWTNSMTDKAIRECLSDLKPDKDFDDLYYAAYARERSDWLIGMNLSRLYSIADNYPHKVGRVKTPVLALVAENDLAIENFAKEVSYRIETAFGALSDESYPTSAQAAEHITEKVKVSGIESGEKSKNRPLLYSLTSLQQDANNIYGFTAKQTLNTAQSLYEKKFITYPRTDCNYISQDMTEKVKAVIDKIGTFPEYAERVETLKKQVLNLDKRMINDKQMQGHDHHAILPEISSADISVISDDEKKIYGLIVNRLLCAVDTEYRYRETVYSFIGGDVNYTLKNITPVNMGWKRYDREIPEYSEFDLMIGDELPAAAHIKTCETRPPNRFTDATLLSVMNNIDNRIADTELKEAVKGKGIGTEATRADIIEQLVSAKYLERQGKSIVSTEFGRAFINSLPDNVKSLERTAMWEQRFDNMHSLADAEEFLDEIKGFVKSVIEYEAGRERTPLNIENDREIIGICPRCHGNIYEGKKNFYCGSGKDGCGFTLWKENRFIKSEITAARAKKLLKGESVPLTALNKDGKEYTADYVMNDTRKYINLDRVKAEHEAIAECPRCHKNIYEGKMNFYCESGRDGCGFTLWKNDRFSGISINADDAKKLISGETIVKNRRKADGGTEKAEFLMEDTGKYVNLRIVK